MISWLIFEFSSSYGESAKSNFSNLTSTEVESWIGLASLLSEGVIMTCSSKIGALSKSMNFSPIMYNENM